ncbi:MAG: aldose epimerase [Gloeocapsa sp. UFS-A4-WI-NPMV-4B04]|nr:aldose epimerase [Gloeocapsa sp. UFS-A4-WI-NPMV-4B04]
MFTIALLESQYKTYILSDEAANSQLEVVPERGGIITQWRIQGQEILYLDMERFTNPELSVRGGIPILFPICGNLPDNTYTYNGQQYILKQHGFARDLPWEVIDQVTQQAASLTLVFNSNEQTRAVYPFDFQLAFTYQILGNSLEIRQKFTNHSPEPMPFSTGLHPYFGISDKTGLQFDIPASQFHDQKTKATHFFSGGFDLNSDEIDAAFRDLGDRSATATDTNRKLQLQLNWDDTYSTLVFWTLKGKNFYCLEPWSAPRNALNTGEQLIHLPPGASHDTLVRMTVNFL